MAYDIRLMKLINGDIIMGKMDEDENKIKDVATLQMVPTEKGVQMLLLPFGYPFEQEITGQVSTEHILYEYQTCPEDLKNKYIEAASNITLSKPGDINNLNMASGGQPGNISNLFKK